MSDNPILTNMDELIRRFPLVKWEKISRDYEGEEAAEKLEEDDTPYTPIIITPDNLASLLMERVTRNEPTADVWNAAAAILKEVT